MVYPFSDTYMTYSTINHRYTLTQQAAKDLCNIDLETQLDMSALPNASNMADQYLDGVSTAIYQYIYTYASNLFAAEYDLAKESKFRNIIKEAMRYQLIYQVANGDLNSASGVNIRTGQILDRKALRAASIAPMSEKMLINSGICYTGYSPAFEPDYEGEAY